jgi:hypothetical protein
VLYVEGTTVNEDMLFCKPIKRRATAKELFKMVSLKKKAKLVRSCWNVQECS